MKHGFTLFEMALVVVIIGLIMGGALVGRNIFSNAELRTIMAENDMYTRSFKEFIDRYQAIPGDMNNATSTWGTDSGCTATSYNTTPKRETCDGDGGGTIGNWKNGTASNQYEWFRAWQHLSNAGLIEGRFTGAQGAAGTTEANIGVNVPKAKIGRNSGWTLLYMATNDSATDTNFFFAPVASHVLMFGAPTSSSFTDGIILKPEEAKSIDEKIDDGMPFTGNVLTKKNASGTCTTTALSTADYKNSYTQNACQLLFLMGM